MQESTNETAYIQELERDPNYIIHFQTELTLYALRQKLSPEDYEKYISSEGFDGANSNNIDFPEMSLLVLELDECDTIVQMLDTLKRNGITIDTDDLANIKKWAIEGMAEKADYKNNFDQNI